MAHNKQKAKTTKYAVSLAGFKDSFCIATFMHKHETTCSEKVVPDTKINDKHQSIQCGHGG